ncbi:MAG: methyltransferase domain-containing protein [candidate division WOR-3 bacterium]
MMRLNDGKLAKALKEKEGWPRNLFKYVKPGKIVEFGCGSGFVLKLLSENFPDSMIIGVDKNAQRLEEVVQKNLKNVIPVIGDITQKIFPDSTFDTALFIGVLHEIFSYSGREKLRNTLRIAYDVLKEKGILIIQDFLKPAPKLVAIKFKNKKTTEKFLRFAYDFKPRKVRFEKINRKIKIDIADALEFISKYKIEDERRWKEEMNETHFFFTEKEYFEILKKTGFKITNYLHLHKRKDWCKDAKKDIEFNFEKEYKEIQLVARRSRSVCH